MSKEKEIAPLFEEIRTGAKPVKNMLLNEECDSLSRYKKRESDKAFALLKQSLNALKKKNITEACEIIKTANLILSIEEDTEVIHKVRQHIINLDRIPRDIFDHSSLAEEWDKLASMSAKQNLSFFENLCRAKQAKQLHAQHQVLINVDKALSAMFGWENETRDNPSISVELADKINDHQDLIKAAKTYLLRICRDLTNTLIHCNGCKIKTNHLKECALKDGIDSNEFLNWELSKDLPQIFELLAEHFFNKASDIAHESYKEYIQLTLCSIYLGYYSIIYNLRSSATNIDNKIDQLCDSANLTSSIEEILKTSLEALNDILSNDERDNKLYSCHYHFDSDKSSNSTVMVSDSRRRGVLHLVLLSMRISLFTYQYRNAPIPQEAIKNGINAIAEALIKHANNDGFPIHQVPIWMYPFAGDALLYISSKENKKELKVIEKANGIALHIINVRRVIQEHNPHVPWGSLTIDEPKAKDILEKVLAGKDPMPRRDGNIIYSLVRIARAMADSDNKEDEKNCTLLNALRFEFDAMFWSSIEKEQHFLRQLNPIKKKIIPELSSNTSESQSIDEAITEPSISNHECCPFIIGKDNGEYNISYEGLAENKISLYVLRSWSSYTPFIARNWGEKRETSWQSRGGGYLIQWGDLGIAIDPGPGFVANLLDAKLSINVIDVVIVTHNHPDHSADLISLLTLAQKSNHKIRGVYLAPNVYSTQKEYVEQSLHSMNDGKAVISPFCCNCSITITVKNPTKNSGKPKIQGSLLIKGLPALHDDIGNNVGKCPSATIKNGSSHYSSFGLVAILRDDKDIPLFRLLITSDTAWRRTNNGTQEEWLLSADKELITNLDILIAHLSRVEFAELASNSFYYNHLGIQGCMMMLNELFPKVAIISEWGEEYSGYRGTIYRAIQEATKNNEKKQPKCCIPGDRGLCIIAELNKDKHWEFKFKCSFPKANQELCGVECSLDDLRVVPQITQEGEVLRYLCSKHIDY